MWPLLIVLSNPNIEIGLQHVDRTVHLFAERDTVKFVEHAALAMLEAQPRDGDRVFGVSGFNQKRRSTRRLNSQRVGPCTIPRPRAAWPACAFSLTLSKAS
jgi:hypothetical protein